MSKVLTAIAAALTIGIAASSSITPAQAGGYGFNGGYNHGGYSHGGGYRKVFFGYNNHRHVRSHWSGGRHVRFR